MMISSEKQQKIILEDEIPRRRFEEEIDRNFLVIAPAGVGKTTALTARICQIALSSSGAEWLPALLVVTYTKKAAREIYQRVLSTLSRKNIAALALLRRAFFGTIDSFFFSLVSEFDEFSGRSKPLQIFTIGDPQETRIWEEFLQSENGNWADILSPDFCRRLLQMTDWQKLMELARRWNSFPPDISPLPPFPPIDFHEMFQFDPETAGIRKNCHGAIGRQQEFIRQWKTAFDAGQSAPLCQEISSGGKDFADFCHCRWIRPLNAWLEIVGGRFCNEMARRYREFRLRRGFATYDDIRCELMRLLADETVRGILQKRHYRLLLDEAQDTLPEAFAIFFKLLAVGEELNTIPQGHLCLVGDPQQSIYLKNAEDFGRFLHICDELKTSGTVETLQFCVTMRCSRAIISRANSIFPAVLSGESGQAKFVPLSPKPNACDGSVCSLPLRHRNEEICSIGDEISALGEFLKNKKPADFGVKCWGDVAILAAARKHLQALQRALEEHGVPSQIRFHDRTWGQRPFFAWICGILQALIFPDDFQEVNFILREIFGIADATIAAHVQRHHSATVFSLLRAGRDSDETETTIALELLREIRAAILRMNLADGCRYFEWRLHLCARASAIWKPAVCDFESIWNEVLSFAFSCDARGKSWWFFVTALQNKFHEKCDADSSQPTRIQLDTFHGSKGLEWPVVILPFFSWNINPHPPEWPFLAKNKNRVHLFLSKQSLRYEELRQREERGHQLLLRRLLYVAMTRSKAHLLLTDFAGKESDKSLIPKKLLHLQNEIFPIWKSAENTPLSPDFSSPERRVFANVSANEVPNREEMMTLSHYLPPPTDCCGKRPSAGNQKTSSDGIWRIHAAGEKFPSPGECKNAAAIDYGRWWHETFRYFPWKSADLQGVYLQNSLSESPDKMRAQKEIAQFLTSDFYRQQKPFSGEYCKEWPFGEALAEENFLFGVIDLVILDSRQSRALVLDWKTDLIGDDELAQLRNRHGKQLLAYEQFIAKKLKIPTRSVFYSTALGKLLEC